MKNYQKLIVTLNLVALALASCSSPEGQNSLKKLVESGTCTPLIPLADGRINLPSGPIVHETDGVATGGMYSVPFQKFENISGPGKITQSKFGESYWFCPKYKK